MPAIVKVELINNYLRENKLSKTAFCKKCKIGISTLNKILDGKDYVKIPVLFKIARVMNVRIYDLLLKEMAGDFAP